MSLTSRRSATAMTRSSIRAAARALGAAQLLLQEEAPAARDAATVRVIFDGVDYRTLDSQSVEVAL
eukprot:2187266-Prymnesium_polylepis.1